MSKIEYGKGAIDGRRDGKKAGATSGTTSGFKNIDPSIPIERYKINIKTNEHDSYTRGYNKFYAAAYCKAYFNISRKMRDYINYSQTHSTQTVDADNPSS